MSYDVKYIGMDVHKEAIVIAVLNEGGKLGSLLLNYGIAQKRTRTIHVFGGHLPTANGRVNAL